MFARLESSNWSQNRITGGGGEWPDSIFHETSPPHRISITSDDLHFFPLPLVLFHLRLLFLLLLLFLSTSSFLRSFVSSSNDRLPHSSSFDHAEEWYIVVSLVALTLSQLDQTTWTTHIPFYEFASD